MNSKPVIKSESAMRILISEFSIIVLLCLLTLSSGLTAETAGPFLKALKAQDLEQLAILIKNGAKIDQSLSNGKTALMVASRAGRSDLIARFIQAGADVNVSNQNGGTALMYSAIQGDAGGLRLLLASGAQVNHIGNNGWTAIVLAAIKNHQQAVAVLLEYGANPNQQDIYGWSALMRAANLNRSAGIASLLKAVNINLDLRDDSGATALHHGAEKNHLKVVEQLLAAGADPNVLDNQGRTAARRAQLSGYSSLAQLIREHRS